jgi:hypothetical protein
LQSRLWVIRVVSDISATFPVALGTVISDLMSGQYSDPVRVVAFNTAEHWSEDASEDVAREILRRLDLAGHDLPSSIQAFVDSHLGPDRQLTFAADLSRCLGINGFSTRSYWRVGSRW